MHAADLLFTDVAVFDGHRLLPPAPCSSGTA